MTNCFRRKRHAMLALLCALLCLLSACSQDLPRAYQRAINAFSKGDYAQAALAFERLGDYAQAPIYAAYSRGLVLFEQGAYAEAEPYFEKSKDFMYGAARYAYCHAHGLEIAGSYAEAAQIFLSLDAFEDAPQRGHYCNARAAALDGNSETALYGYEAAGSYADAPILLESLQQEMYAYAKELQDKNEYEKALNIFGKLGAYFDSATQARDCKDHFRSLLYDEAEAMERDGRLQEAYDAFSGLSGYSDAEVRAQTLASKLGIEETLPEE